MQRQTFIDALDGTHAAFVWRIHEIGSRWLLRGDLRTTPASDQAGTFCPITAVAHQHLCATRYADPDPGDAQDAGSDLQMDAQLVLDVIHAADDRDSDDPGLRADLATALRLDHAHGSDEHPAASGQPCRNGVRTSHRNRF